MCTGIDEAVVHKMKVDHVIAFHPGPRQYPRRGLWFRNRRHDVHASARGWRIRGIGTASIH